MTSSLACANPTTATSNEITMTVTTTVAPSVTIAANPGNTICAGTSVTFNATPTNGGVTPSYQWKLNGANVGTNSNTYQNAAFANGAKITCVMTSSLACANPTTATSNEITMAVTSTVAPSVLIVANPGNIDLRRFECHIHCYTNQWRSNTILSMEIEWSQCRHQQQYLSECCTN